MKFIGNRFAMRYAFHKMCPGHFAIMNPGDKYFISRYPFRYGPQGYFNTGLPFVWPPYEGNSSPAPSYSVQYEKRGKQEKEQLVQLWVEKHDHNCTCFSVRITFLFFDTSKGFCLLVQLGL